jgi:hypothetical protein
MSKQMKGFLFGTFVLVVLFFIVVSIMGACNGRNFVDEMKSWGTQVEDTTGDDTTGDTTGDENDDTSTDEEQTDEQSPESTEVAQSFKVIYENDTAVIMI